VPHETREIQIWYAMGLPPAIFSWDFSKKQKTILTSFGRKKILPVFSGKITDPSGWGGEHPQANTMGQKIQILCTMREGVPWVNEV